jgi:hypothetical protein
VKEGQPITIAYDLSPDSYRAAIAHRAMLEYYTHHVALVPVESEQTVRSFLESPPRSALTILMCHGWGKTDDDAVISFEIARPVDRVHYERFQLELTPARLGEFVDHGAGIFLNTACWSGKDAFARVFLKAGFDAYIAPEKTSDSFSGFQFVAAFAGTLLHEVRDWGPYPVATRQAYERAKASDDFWDGAAGFRLFEQDQA